MKNLAIFDLDGTLLNTISDLGEACNHALKTFGFPLHSADEYPHLVGNGVNKLIERALPEGAKTEDNILRLREVFIPFYDEHNMVHTRPYSGINEVLQYLKSKDYYLAVASNKYQAATEALVEHYFPHIFDVVLGERVGCPRKPDAQIVNDIIARCDLNSTDSNIIYIGDSDVDMQTARNANLPVIACSYGFCDEKTLLSYNPNYIVSTPTEIINIL